MNLNDWASRWALPPQALEELKQGLAQPCQVEVSKKGISEGAVSQRCRLAAASNGEILWRNNVGQLKNGDGVPVRYGLANDSPKVNAKVKSSDLIGVTPLSLGGKTVGVFTAVETKKQGWSYKGDAREEAQLRYHNIVLAHGGIAGFATSENDYLEIIRRYTRDL